MIYNKNRFELEAFGERSSLPYEVQELLRNVLDFQGSFEETAEKTKAFYTNEGMRNSLKELEALMRGLVRKGDIANAYFDLSMMAAFDYYDGIIFKEYYPHIYKPILSGGRYDYLTERMGRKVPAVGFTVDINELMKFIYKDEA